MKRTLLVIALSALSALIVNAQKPAPQAPRQTRAAVEQAILQLEKDWVDALIKADTAKLEELYADTLVYTHSSGQVDDKAKYIANLKAGGTKYLAIDRSEIKANVYGNSVVVTCKAAIKLVSGGQERAFDARVIHVYVKQPEQWRMVAHQTTRIG